MSKQIRHDILKWFSLKKMAYVHCYGIVKCLFLISDFVYQRSMPQMIGLQCIYSLWAVHMKGNESYINSHIHLYSNNTHLMLSCLLVCLMRASQVFVLLGPPQMLGPPQLFGSSKLFRQPQLLGSPELLGQLQLLGSLKLLGLVIRCHLS